VVKKSRREVKLTLPYGEPIRGLSRDVVMVTRVIWKLFIQHAHSTRSELVHGCCCKPERQRVARGLIKFVGARDMHDEW